MPYRTLPNGEPEITIVNIGSNFWLRLRTNLRARRWLLLAMAAVGTAAAAPVAVVAMLIVGSRADDLGPLFVHLLERTAPLVIGFFVVPILAVIVLSSVTPNEMERLLPRGLVLREAAIEVLTYGGERIAERWSYIAEATETADTFDLILQREPRLFLVLAKSRLGSREATLLRQWLTAHRCLRP